MVGQAKMLDKLVDEYLKRVVTLQKPVPHLLPLVEGETHFVFNKMCGIGIVRYHQYE